ncbi:uncharacterized protein LOC132299599 [Cornus florida]|uniref:uncharacterized protein LOC132299599 n=1 Tax=Cornus florida TaxID=4283 RepID=UPI0028A09642|nr:uncharacterized protein LOC132299599 [Cornus florida]
MVERPESSGIWYWNDDDDDEESSQEFQNNAVSGFQSSEALEPNRIILSTEFNQQEVELDSSKEGGPLGLTLKKTPSFVNLVEMTLFETRNTAETNCSSGHFVSQPKASNLPASFLKIGSWNRIARNEGDLVAKWYYAKRKLVWEILGNGLKSKIEIQWENISAIRATIRADEPGILEIELNHPPLFFRETDPQPRKHTIWQQASDFTGGEAPKCRRHYVEFPPNTLDRHYQKLLQWDKRLFMLSLEPFPSLKPPYFILDNELSFGSKGISPEFPLQRPFSSIPLSYMVPPHRVSTFEPTARPPLGVMNFGSPMSVIDYGFENQRKSLWGQGINNVVLAREDQIQIIPSSASATQTNSDFSCQDCGEEAISLPNTNTITLSDIEHHLLSDSDVECSNERTLALGSVLEPTETNPNIGIRPDHFEYTLKHSRVDGGLLGPQPLHYLPRQVSQEDRMVQQWTNNALYPYRYSDLMEEDFATVNGIHGECRWMLR